MKKVITLLLILFVAISFRAIAEENTTITMMSYNIKGHAMTSARMDEVAKVINYMVPDIVSVQEVDNRTVIGLRHNYMEDLATATNMKYQFFPLVSTYYGIGLLSKTAPIHVETKAFPFSDSTKDKEDRGIIIAEFEDFYFIATHYSLNANDRDTATSWICSFADSADKTVFVAGDFNAQPTYRALVTFKNRGFKILNDINQFTYPSTGATSCIDMVICNSNMDGAKKYEVIESGVAPVTGVILANVSDHLPVYVELKATGAGVADIENNDMGIECINGNLKISGIEEETSLSIIDLSGRNIKNEIIDEDASINLFNACTRGVYIVTLINSKQSLSKKILL